MFIFKKLADLAGTSPEEIAIHRNTTEALGTIIFGLDLKKGDEVVLCGQEYPNMMNAFRQREKRDGIVLKLLSIPVPPSGPEEVMEIYRKAITPQTKIVHVSHMINLTGETLPVRAISDMAHKHGIE